MYDIDERGLGPDERCGAGIVACRDEKIDRIGPHHSERHLVGPRDEARTLSMGRGAKTEVMDAPVIVQRVPLVESVNERAQPRPEVVSAFDSAKQRPKAGVMCHRNHELGG